MIQIIYHGGPTNSGKTYAALQRLKTAKRGLYVGPLRLLAAEIYESLNAQGVYTSLITGQERREFPFSTHVAATVEMAANLLEEEWDVIVIDEIQMIRDKERGFAWTRALLGLRCKEIHVCGGLEAKNLIKEIAQACNDDFELNTYERFGKLEVATNSLASRPDQLGSYKWVSQLQVRCYYAFIRFSMPDQYLFHDRFKLGIALLLFLVMTFSVSSVRLSAQPTLNVASFMARFLPARVPLKHSFSMIQTAALTY